MNKVIIKLRKCNKQDTETVKSELAKRKFCLIDDLGEVGVLLGHYDGDLSELEKIEGVSLAVPDGEMQLLK